MAESAFQALGLRLNDGLLRDGFPPPDDGTVLQEQNRLSGWSEFHFIKSPSPGLRQPAEDPRELQRAPSGRTRRNAGHDGKRLPAFFRQEPFRRSVFGGEDPQREHAPLLVHSQPLPVVPNFGRRAAAEIDDPDLPVERSPHPNRLELGKLKLKPPLRRPRREAEQGIAGAYTESSLHSVRDRSVLRRARDEDHGPHPVPIRADPGLTGGGPAPEQRPGPGGQDHEGLGQGNGRPSPVAGARGTKRDPIPTHPGAAGHQDFAPAECGAEPGRGEPARDRKDGRGSLILALGMTTA